MRKVKSTREAGSKRPRCEICGKTISSRAKRCPSCAKLGQRNHWKGGETVTTQGRVLVQVGREHPMSNCQGYVARSRLMMTTMIGRFLKAGEVVHHEDGNYQNDHPLNLKLFKNESKHQKYHARVRQEQAV